jgi:hypothetical protein
MRIGWLAGISRCEPGRVPALGASGSYASVAAAINSWLQLGPYTASASMGYS